MQKKQTINNDVTWDLSPKGPPPLTAIPAAVEAGAGREGGIEATATGVHAAGLGKKTVDLQRNVSLAHFNLESLVLLL